MRAVTEVAERELRVVAYMHSCAIAIGPRLCSVHYDVFRIRTSRCDAAFRCRISTFVAQLRGVVDVLVVASAASGEVRAAGSMRCGAGARMRSAFARVNPGRLSVTVASTVSPGITKGTKTALPGPCSSAGSRVRPSPP